LKSSKDTDIDSLELEFLARGAGGSERSDRLASSSLTPMLLDLDEETPTRDELASRFFAKPEPTTQAPLPVDDAAREIARFESPAFKERQRYLMRYVAGAVAFSGAICLAAFFRIAAAATDPSAQMPHASQAARAFEPFPTPPAELPAEPVVAAAVIAPPPPAPVPQEAPVAATPVAPAAPAAPAKPSLEPASTPAAASPAAVAPSEGPSARESKDAAMQALEHGKWNAAIASAERSVKLDPTDAEAWLILGGAYQERGSDRAAHRAYASCSQSAKPSHARSECASLARAQ
jgi:hypothetical protein